MWPSLSADVLPTPSFTKRMWQGGRVAPAHSSGSAMCPVRAPSAMGHPWQLRRHSVAGWQRPDATAAARPVPQSAASAVPVVHCMWIPSTSRGPCWSCTRPGAPRGSTGPGLWQATQHLTSGVGWRRAQWFFGCPDQELHCTYWNGVRSVVDPSGTPQLSTHRERPSVVPHACACFPAVLRWSCLMAG